MPEYLNDENAHSSVLEAMAQLGVPYASCSSGFFERNRKFGIAIIVQGQEYTTSIRVNGRVPTREQIDFGARELGEMTGALR